MQVNQQLTGTQQALDNELTEAVEEALTMAEFFNQVGQRNETPNLDCMHLPKHLESVREQLHEIVGIDVFAGQKEAKAGRPK